MINIVTISPLPNDAHALIELNKALFMLFEPNEYPAKLKQKTDSINQSRINLGLNTDYFSACRSRENPYLRMDNRMPSATSLKGIIYQGDLLR